MGQARNRGTREERVAQAIQRNEAEDKANAESAAERQRQHQVNSLAHSLALGMYAAARRPEATRTTTPEAK